MKYEAMEQHVGHELTIGIIHDDDAAGTPIGLSLDCTKCEVVLAKEMKPRAEAKFTKHEGEWCLKVENGGDLEVGDAVHVTVFKTGEEKTIAVGEKLADVGGNYPGAIYAAGEEL